MYGGGAGEMAKKITKEEVIEKLKDDGDFDRLRLKIIRRLKENEGLRDSIISVVKQSTALNRPGAQSMKPRQLSDAIFEEVGGQVMSQLSDGLWGIIRSEDGMKNEITETVQSVYNKLSNPGGTQEEKRDGSSTRDAGRLQTQNDQNNPRRVTMGEENCSHSDNEPPEPPGFSLLNDHCNNSKKANQNQELIQPPVEEKMVESHAGVDVPETNRRTEDSDEDPEVPPGFG